MSIEKFKNPVDIESVRTRIVECPTMKEVHDLIEQILPGWIIEYLADYSADYQHLRYNWKEACKMIGVRPAKIMIVEYIGFTDEYSLTRFFAEFFTHVGFVVRSRAEIITCSKCNLALPGRTEHEKMKNAGLQVPDVWSETCSKCKSV